MQAQNFLPSQDFLHTITYRLALAHCCSLTERLADEVQDEMKSAEWNNATHERWEALPWEPTHVAGASSVHSYILQDRLSLDIVTAWVQFLESWYSFSWWRELLWYGKTPHIQYCEHVCTHTPHFTPLSVPYQSHRIPWPDASRTVQLFRAQWEGDGVWVGGTIIYSHLVCHIFGKNISCIWFFLGYLQAATHAASSVSLHVFHWHSSLHF